MTFTQTLDAHLKAIAGRDLDAFVATIAADPKVSVILPNGALIVGREAITDFHSAWFADPDWHMATTVLHTIETGEMALALLLVDYRDLDPDGQPYAKRYYLNLVFAKQGHDWRLVHDQNTFARDEA